MTTCRKFAYTKKKTYAFNYKAFGGRIGDLVIGVDKDKSKEVASSLLKKYKDNVVYCDTRITQCITLLLM